MLDIVVQKAISVVQALRALLCFGCRDREPVALPYLSGCLLESFDEYCSGEWLPFAGWKSVVGQSGCFAHAVSLFVEFLKEISAERFGAVQAASTGRCALMPERCAFSYWNTQVLRCVSPKRADLCE
jgi:hypothetical protein